MSFKALIYAYVLGGLTFLPLLVLGLITFTIYTSVPIGDPDPQKFARGALEKKSAAAVAAATDEPNDPRTEEPGVEVNDTPRPRRGWLTMRRTFEESSFDTSYVTLVKSFLDARSKDPKRSRPRDMWYVVLKGRVLYLYEDENMTECEAAIQLASHDVVVYPEGLLDGELFAKRNAICLKPRLDEPPGGRGMFSVTREMRLWREDVDAKVEKSGKRKQKDKDREKEKVLEQERRRELAREEALDATTPWFIFVRSNVEMEDWYLALVHASNHPPGTPLLSPLQPVFSPVDMSHLVSTLDEQPDVIPMRWLNALLGRIFFSYYRTDRLESYVIGRLMKKLSKVKRPQFLSDIVVTEVYPGTNACTFSKPMLKELTKEGDAALEVRMQYKGEFRITIQATATINLGSRFNHTVKLVLAVILRELEGNMVIRVKRPPSNRIWYAFTQMPKMVLNVEPVVSDRQITWSMILHTIESRLKEIILESVVLPNMDDIAFFDSRDYDLRGGIWPDAARHERPASVPPPEGKRKTKEEKQRSAEEGDLPSGEALSASDSSVSAGVPRSHSETELSPRTNTTGTTSEPSRTPPDSVNRSNTTAVDMPTPQHSASAPAPVRRKTWFSNHLNHHKHGSPNHLTEEPEPMPDAGAEGEPGGIMRRRTSDSDPSQTQTQFSHESSSSDTHHSKETHDSKETHRSKESHHHKHWRLLPPRPSSRNRSRSRSPSPSPSRPSTPPPPVPPPPPPMPPFDRTMTRSPNPSLRSASSSLSLRSGKSTKTKESGLLSMLKRTAAERQGLGGSAKETIRKWGVNWSVLRRDTAKDEGDEDRERERSFESEDASRKAGMSYAEVRAHVDERRERDRLQKTPTPPLPNPYAHPNFEVTAPVPVPAARRPSLSSQLSTGAGAGGSSYLSGGSRSSSPRSFQAPTMSSADLSIGSASRSEVDYGRVSPRPVSVDDRSSKSGVEEEDTTPPTPIHTQPSQGKTMTIPGIHAKHRGEVMSMGYAPPSPPQATLAEGKGKSPGIQNMYRLWRTTSAEPSEPQQEQPESQEPPERDLESSLSSHPPSADAPRRSRTPPPLPPRSASISSGSQKSPVSAVLESIASRDEQHRAMQVNGSEGGVESLHSPQGPDINVTAPSTMAPQMSPRPPLPPRRVPAPAS